MRIVGGPPAGTDREVVDNSYDYAIIVEFENAEMHGAYQMDSLHNVFREKYGTYFEKLQIYDSLN